MKKIILLLFIPGFVFSQALPPKKNTEKSTQISGITGDKNIITVIQGNGNIVKYNITDDKQAQLFLDYLKTIPNLNKDIKQLLQYDKKIFSLVTKIYEKTNDEGFFNSDKFFEKLDVYIRENERLKVENEELKKQTKGTDFAKVLEEANTRLEQYDNEGYDNLLENYKITKKQEIGLVAYLQAKNNNNNYNNNKALLQINEALWFTGEKVDPLLLKAYILTDLAKYDESINVFLKVTNFKINDSLTVRIFSDIGLVYLDKGEYEKGLESFLKALAIHEKLIKTGSSGPDSFIIAAIFTNIGLAYSHKEDYDNAFKYYTKALAIHEKSLSIKHLNTEPVEIAALFNNIALTYQGKQKYEDALGYYKKALIIYERELGKKHPNTAISYNNIGSIYDNMGYYDDAMEYFKIALVIQEDILGKEHPNTALSYNNIASIFYHKKDYQKALEYCKKALFIRQKILGEEHINTASTLSNIGAVYYLKADYDSTLWYFKKALAIYEKKSGKESNDVITSYTYLGMAYYRKQNFDISLECYYKALLIQEKVFQKESSTTATLYYNIGVSCLDKGDYDIALTNFGKTFDILEKVFGKEHSTTITTYQNIGLFYIYKGFKETGLRYLTKTSFSKLSAYSKSVFLSNQALANFNSGKHKEALNAYQVAIDFLEESNFPKTDTLWVVIYQNMANACCHNNQKEKALSLFEKALLLYKDIKEGDTSVDIEKLKKSYEDCKRK